MPKANVRSFRDILVYLSVGDNAPARLGAAIGMAQVHGARLIGVEVDHPGGVRYRPRPRRRRIVGNLPA